MANLSRVTWDTCSVAGHAGRHHTPGSPTAQHPARRIIVDTKFTAITKPGHYREATLASGYVYQIYAYLMSQQSPGLGAQTEGLMLHPTVGEPIDEEVVIQGHRIRFATVDLTAPPRALTAGFLAAIWPTPAHGELNEVDLPRFAECNSGRRRTQARPRDDEE